MNYFKYFLFICIFILLIALILSVIQRKQEPESTGQTKVKIDTILIAKPAKPIIINKVKTKLIKRIDTVFLANPFVACIDTIIRHDTIKAEFSYPENLFTLKLNPSADSVFFINRTEITKIRQEAFWWEKPALISLGFIGGILFHTIIK